MQSFSERLAKARKAKRLTQPQLAERLGVSKGAVGNWEKGSNLPNQEHLRKIAEILGLATETNALEEDATPYRTGTIPVELLSDEVLRQTIQQLAQSLSESGSHERGRVIEALRSAVSEEDRRRDLARQKASLSAIPAEATAGGLAAEEVAERERARSSPRAGAGGTSGAKPSPPPDVSHGTKEPPPGNPGPARN